MTVVLVGAGMIASVVCVPDRFRGYESLVFIVGCLLVWIGCRLLNQGDWMGRR